MSFFERNRKALIERGYDPARLPPGQYHTDRFPVLHVGDVPVFDPATWTFRMFGAVAQERTLSWDELRAMPATEVVTDIHCVTKWSKFDTQWKGVLVRDVVALVDLDPGVTHVLQHAEHGYTTNSPLADLLADDVLLAWEFGGEPLAPEHGGPLRVMLPKLYFWKSAKWVRGLEFLRGDRPGFWEENGYHNVGDPWTEQRYWGD